MIARLAQIGNSRELIGCEIETLQALQLRQSGFQPVVEEVVEGKIEDEDVEGKSRRRKRIEAVEGEIENSKRRHAEKVRNRTLRTERQKIMMKEKLVRKKNWKERMND